MSTSITRRDFLRIAGGVTFLALVPNGKGGFAATSLDKELPLFTVVPYIQPGPASQLIPGQDTLVVMWQTEDAPADFTVDFGLSKSYGSSAKIVQARRGIGKGGKASVPPAQPVTDGSDVSGRLNYRALLPNLPLATKVYYRVSGNGQTIAEGYATTRMPRGSKIRFVTFGDNSYGDISDRQIAYYAYKAKPDFVMNTGDNVYESGLDNEYARYFFPAYNSDVAAPHDGAPLLRSVPFYTVMANHDVNGRDDDGGIVADFTVRDTLGIFTAMSMPLNGPTNIKAPVPITGPEATIEEFKTAAGDRFPVQANYSFDCGDAHFCCLDSNQYVDPSDPALQAWIDQDLGGTDALWKFVVFHHPSFNVGGEHYEEQHFRVLSPLFEKHNVDLALHGHEHTYQRTMPLRFVPGDISKAGDITSKDRRVPGTFTVDTTFDGVKNTVPDGVIYLTTGAGGKELYEPDFTDSPEKWLHPDDNNVAYVSKFYSRHHSLTVIDLDGPTLKLTQINELGDIVDEMTVTKKA